MKKNINKNSAHQAYFSGLLDIGSLKINTSLLYTIYF